MRFQSIKTQQTAISAVSLAATQPIIHSNVGPKIRDLFTRGKVNSVACSLVLAVLTACGGGGGGGESATTTGGSFSTPTLITGRVADGYINGATVFWDCNGDIAPNASEKQVKSGVGGIFSISNAPSSNCILAAYVPVGAKDEDVSSQTVNRSYTMLSTRGNEQFISPISTMVATHLSENPGVTILDASQVVANFLGISGNIHSDYIAETGANAIRRHGVSIVLANVLQKNNTPGATAASLSEGYAEAKSRAPSIASAGLTTPASINSFINPFRGFLKQSSSTAFSKLALDNYAVRPNSKLSLTSSQLTALNAVINLPAIVKVTRLGVINWSELTDAEFAEALNSLNGAGLIADVTPRVQAIRESRQVVLTATNDYFQKNLAQSNKFFASNIAANFQFIVSTSISGVEAIGGAISAGTGIDVPNLYRYRGKPIAKGIIKTTTQPEIRDLVLALLNATSLSLESTKNINAALKKGDDEELSKAEFDSLIELVDQLITIQKDILKKGDFALAGKFFGPAVKFYGVTQECDSASSECFAASLEILETVAEWIPGTPTRVKGLLKWIRSTFDAYSQGKEYAAVTDGEVIFARDEVLKDWDLRIAQIMLASRKAEFSVGGYERYFEGYDPTPPPVTLTCKAPLVLQDGKCVTTSVITTNPGQSEYTLTPNTAILGVLTTFTFRSSGGGLSSPLVFSLSNCSAVTAVAGATQFEQKFTCTPTGAAGVATGIVKSNPANTYGFDFSVIFSAATVGSPAVTGASPGTLQRNVTTMVTVTGTNLPPAVVFAISQVVCSGNYTRSSTSVSQTCTAQPDSGTTEYLTVNNVPNGTSLLSSGQAIAFSIPAPITPIAISGLSASQSGAGQAINGSFSVSGSSVSLVRVHAGVSASSTACYTDLAASTGAKSFSFTGNWINENGLNCASLLPAAGGTSNIVFKVEVRDSANSLANNGTAPIVTASYQAAATPIAVSGLSASQSGAGQAIDGSFSVSGSSVSLVRIHAGVSASSTACYTDLAASTGAKSFSFAGNWINENGLNCASLLPAPGGTSNIVFKVEARDSANSLANNGIAPIVTASYQAAATPIAVSGLSASQSGVDINGSFSVSGSSVSLLRVHVGVSASSSACYFDFAASTGAKSFSVTRGFCPSLFPAPGGTSNIVFKVEARDSAGSLANNGTAPTITVSYQAAAAPIATVNSASPGTLQRNVPTTVTVSGANLPSTVAFAISNVVCNGNYSRSSISVSQTCTAQPGTPSSVSLTVKDAPGGNFLANGNQVIFFSVQ